MYVCDSQRGRMYYMYIHWSCRFTYQTPSESINIKNDYMCMYVYGSETLNQITSGIAILQRTYSYT